MNARQMRPTQLLQDHFEDPYHRGSCEIATHAADAQNPETGCQIRLEFAVNDTGEILEAWWDGQACPTCEGLASIAVEQLEGSMLSAIEVEQTGCPLEPNELWKCQANGKEGGENSCHSFVWGTIVRAARTPLAALEEDLADSQQFGGPSLREEC